MGCIPLCISERREVVDMTLFGSFVLSFLVWLASPSTHRRRGWQARLLAFWEDAICKDVLQMAAWLEKHCGTAPCACVVSCCLPYTVELPR